MSIEFKVGDSVTSIVQYYISETTEAHEYGVTYDGEITLFARPDRSSLEELFSRGFCGEATIVNGDCDITLDLACISLRTEDVGGIMEVAKFKINKRPVFIDSGK